ncbi:hypothetical protein KKG08_00870 [Patescibacteria group bacterium]|nr:hypothetical protein [Patescibacteria group bacterium]
MLPISTFLLIVVFLVAVVPTVSHIKALTEAYYLNKYIGVKEVVFGDSAVDNSTIKDSTSDLGSIYNVLDIQSSSLQEEVPSNSEISNNSVFDKLGDSTSFDGVNYYFLDFREFINELTHKIPVDKSWENWEKDTYYIHSYVVDIREDYLVINIMYPENKPFSGIQKEVKVECGKTNSIIVTNVNFDLVSPNVDIFKQGMVGDGFFTYCLDERCEKVGKSCVLIKEIQR